MSLLPRRKRCGSGSIYFFMSGRPGGGGGSLCEWLCHCVCGREREGERMRERERETEREKEREREREREKERERKRERERFCVCERERARECVCVVLSCHIVGCEWYGMCISWGVCIVVVPSRYHSIMSWSHTGVFMCHHIIISVCACVITAPCVSGCNSWCNRCIPTLSVAATVKHTATMKESPHALRQHLPHSPTHLQALLACHQPPKP